MRLDRVREILAENVDRLKIGSQPAESNRIIRVSGIKPAIDAIRTVRSTGMFQELCKQLLSVEPLARATQDPIVITAETFSHFSSNLNSLQSQVQIVSGALGEYIDPIPPESLRIKLPDTTDLEATAKTLLDINKLLSQLVVNDYAKGDVRLESFAEGTSWVDIYVGSWSAYHLIAGLVRLYFEIKQRHAQEQAREQLLEGLAVEVATRNAIMNAIATEIDNYKATRMREYLEENNIPADDHEFVRRIENATRLLGTLLERGVEIHPALTAPVEERKLLPDPKSIVEAIKALPANSDNKDEPKGS